MVGRYWGYRCGDHGGVIVKTRLYCMMEIESSRVGVVTMSNFIAFFLFSLCSLLGSSSDRNNKMDNSWLILALVADTWRYGQYLSGYTKPQCRRRGIDIESMMVLREHHFATWNDWPTQSSPR
ncbi:hypothetical protein ASPBRDRAFT_540544 [Aspergillus brasiliensis CBS 101740]|uniref:Uncharacterized protein n=1 Tax=Aspergillus brasiliensis (strain CBS 101740 / IMI 381727 / IBT 21946) TaxID=767769 RepID=A0A1L9UL79_ASPBC|nr:hypothetical protein ASPBRDRAFT_540544 [Aspergillus brasiliensis CBS 101740]